MWAPLAFVLATVSVVRGFAHDHRNCDHHHPKDHELIVNPHVPEKRGRIGMESGYRGDAGSYEINPVAHILVQYVRQGVKKVIHGAFIEPEHVMRKRSIDQNLRVKLFYDHSVFRIVLEFAFVRFPVQKEEAGIVPVQRLVLTYHDQLTLVFWDGSGQIFDGAHLQAGMQSSAAPSDSQTRFAPTTNIIPFPGNVPETRSNVNSLFRNSMALIRISQPFVLGSAVMSIKIATDVGPDLQSIPLDGVYTHISQNGGKRSGPKGRINDHQSALHSPLQRTLTTNDQHAAFLTIVSAHFSNSSPEPLYSGSIISPRLVLTYHDQLTQVFWDGSGQIFDGAHLQAGMQSSAAPSDSQTRFAPITNIIPFPEYVPETRSNVNSLFRNSMALIEISQPFVLGSAVMSIKIATD
ncbi:unnamed protein product, partial [Notodromas monacha]